MVVILHVDPMSQVHADYRYKSIVADIHSRRKLQQSSLNHESQIRTCWSDLFLTLGTISIQCAGMKWEMSLTRSQRFPKHGERGLATKWFHQGSWLLVHLAELAVKFGVLDGVQRKYFRYVTTRV